MANLEFLSDVDETFDVDCRLFNSPEMCTNFMCKKYNLKILTFNIRSLQKNFD